MVHYTLRNNAQFNGAFTDLFIVGTTRVIANSGRTSDFTAAATTQTITLLALNIGDVIVYPLAQAWVKVKFTDGATEGAAAVTLANLKADVGVTGATTQFIAGTNGDLIQSPNYPITPAVAAGAPYACQAASKNLLLTLTSTAGNMSTITYGELWIYVAIARVGDHVRDIAA